MHSHLKFQQWLMMWTTFSFASVFTNKCPPPFFFFSFTYPSEGLTSCMPVGHSSEGVQAGELWQLGGFSALTSNCVAWRLSPVVQHLRWDVAGWQAVNSTSCMGLPPWGKSWGAPRLGWRIWSETVVKPTEQETCMKHKIWKTSAYTKKEFSNSLLILEQTSQLLARVAGGSTQQDRKQQALPRHTEARTRLCSGLSILHLAADTSSHYCPRKVLVHLLYKPWRRFSPSLLTLYEPLLGHTSLIKCIKASVKLPGLREILGENTNN